MVFLWFFQVFFIDTYYEYSKTKQIKSTTEKIIKNFNNNIEYLDIISYEDNVCIEIVKNENII